MKLALEAISISPAMLSVAPSITIKMRARVLGASQVHALVLRARIRVLASAHAYTEVERARLAPLFGEASQWTRTTRAPVPWAEISVATGRFETESEIDLAIPCSYDLSIATTKLFDALDEGASLPLSIVFAGTLFYADEEYGAMRVEPLSSDLEARIDLPIDVWRALMDAHHADGAFLRVSRTLADRLRRCESGDAGDGKNRSVATLEQMIETLVYAKEHRA